MCDTTEPQEERRRVPLANPALVTADPSSANYRRTLSSLPTTTIDLFVSHCKRLPESEDRAVWVADVCEQSGLVAFFDRSDLKKRSPRTR